MKTAQFDLHADIEQRHWWFVARRRILTAVVNALVPPARDAMIVDVGCGTGANLAGLADQYECVGIDSSSQAIRLARERFPQVRFVHGLAPRDLGPAMDQARVILMTDVLEHVADDFQLLSELLAAAQPGAYFVLTVPANQSLWTQHDETFGHYRRYDRQRFEQLWSGLPVATRFVSHYNARLYPLVKAVRWWNRVRGRAGGLVGTDFNVPPTMLNRALASCFAGESDRLVRLARGKFAVPYRHGVSLMAVIQRQTGPLRPRVKPQSVAADYYDPSAELVTATA